MNSKSLLYQMALKNCLKRCGNDDVCIKKCIKKSMKKIRKSYKKSKTHKKKRKSRKFKDLYLL